MYLNWRFDVSRCSRMYSFSCSSQWTEKQWNFPSPNTRNTNTIWTLQVIAKLIDKCQTVSREITPIQDWAYFTEIACLCPMHKMAPISGHDLTCFNYILRFQLVHARPHGNSTTDECMISHFMMTFICNDITQYAWYQLKFYEIKKCCLWANPPSTCIRRFTVVALTVHIYPLAQKRLTRNTSQGMKAIHSDVMWHNTDAC